MEEKGRIIVIEGTDKAGKETQSRMLFETLKDAGKACAIISFPAYETPIGMEIRAFLNGKRDYLPQVKHLLFSANRWEKKEEIENSIKKGIVIIMDRYWQSNLIYGVANGMNANWLLKLDKGLPKEDLVIALLVNPQTSSNRATIQDDFESNANLAAKAYRNYKKFAKQFNWKIIDGSMSKEQVHQEILKIIRKKLKV